jgi:hypothetical protein
VRTAAASGERDDDAADEGQQRERPPVRHAVGPERAVLDERAGA